MTAPLEKTPVGALKRTWQNWALLGLLVVCWGSTFALTKIGVESFTPQWLVALRLGLASVFLVPFMYATGRRPPGLEHARNLFVLALTGYIVPFYLISWGTQFIASGLAGILMAITPLVVTVLAHAFLPDERMGVVKLAGILVGLGGTVFMVGPDKLLHLHGQDMEVWGQLAVLLGAISYGVHSIVARRMPAMGAVERATGVCLIGTAVTLPLALWEAPTNPASASYGAWLAIFALALFPTAFALVILYRLLERAGASFTSLVNYLIPIYAAILGAAVLGERLEQQIFAGLALILLGIAISEIGFRRS